MKNYIQLCLLYLYKIVVQSGFLNTIIGEKIFLSAYFFYKEYIESESIKILKKYIKENDTIIDVGANIGWFTKHACDWVQPNGKVISIEPEKNNLLKLNKLIKTNKLANAVDVIEAAVSDYNGSLYLNINPYHPGDHKISDEKTDSSVEAITIDSIVNDKSLKELSLIKIDVQGSEMRVLNGSVNTIKKMKPIFFIEIDEDALNKMNSSTHEILTFMKSYQYIPYLLKNNTVCKTEYNEIMKTLSHSNGYLDVLFLQ